MMNWKISVWKLSWPIARRYLDIHLEGLKEKHKNVISVKKIQPVYLMSLPKLEAYGWPVSRIKVARLSV
jgi:hypothetical protein